MVEKEWCNNRKYSSVTPVIPADNYGPKMEGKLQYNIKIMSKCKHYNWVGPLTILLIMYHVTSDGVRFCSQRANRISNGAIVWLIALLQNFS